MNTTSDRLAERYLAALRTHVAAGAETSLAPAVELGRDALRMGLEALDVVQFHEQALVGLMISGQPPEGENGTLERAEVFFRHALAPLTEAADAAGGANARTKQPKTPAPTAALNAVKKRLQRETSKRKAAEAALKESRLHYSDLLAQSRLMQKQLRHLSHRILLAQEEERKQISRELHDEISQVLTGINVRLAALKIETAANAGSLKRKIGGTQRLVEKSVATVHRFARELRPAMLDDLGLVPALLAYLKDVRKRTGLQIRFTTPKSPLIDTLDNLRRTVLYRIAQEALTNVAKHAQASLVDVSIALESNAVCMEVTDDGKSFSVADILRNRRRKRLGLIGMRERAEMIGGTFDIESAPDKGTTVRVRIPLGNGAGKG